MSSDYEYGSAVLAPYHGGGWHKDREACTDANGHFAYVAVDGLGICGCGWHDVYVAEAVNVLRTLRDKGSLFGDHWTMLNPDQWTPMGAELLLNLMDKAELLEHGGSILGSWVTDKGKRLLAILDDKPDDWLDSAPGYCCGECPDIVAAPEISLDLQKDRKPE